MTKFLAFVVLSLCFCYSFGDVQVSVDTSKIRGRTSGAAYVSFNFDWHTNDEEYPAWYNASIMNMSLLQNADLVILASALSPAYLRIGGSEGDQVFYAVNEPCWKETHFCLTMGRWDEINLFAIKTGLQIVFGVNAMYGRNSSTAHFNPANLREFLKHTASMRNYTALYGFEFGNELTTLVQPEVYADDLLVVRQMIDDYWGDLPRDKRPRLIANDENPNAGYWSILLPRVGNAIDILTWHLYIGYGLDPNLINDAWNSSWLVSSISSSAKPLLSVASQYLDSGGSIWVGETALAWHSGRNLVTNSFSSGPWMIAQLGTLAGTHKVQCRQTLVGGWYELINSKTRIPSIYRNSDENESDSGYTPNPDYWTALLWKKLMGAGSLTVTSDTEDLLVFAHCSTMNSGISFAFVNTNSTQDYKIVINGIDTTTRHVYLVSHGSGGIQSQQLLLNGFPLTYENGVLSPTLPIIVNDPTVPIEIPAQSYGFIVFPLVKNPCN